MPRFTQGVNDVMDRANAEAIRLNHEYVGTEHILLGLIKTYPSVLKEVGHDPLKILLEVEKIILPYHSAATKMKKLPMTPRSKCVMEHTINSRKDRNVHPTNPANLWDLLYGLLKETDGIASQILLNQGLTFSRVLEIQHAEG